MPHHSVGATTTAASPATTSAAAWHTASLRMVSTPTGRCGPCCSMDATGSTTMASAAALARRSAAVRNFHMTDCMALTSSPSIADPALDIAELHGGQQHDDEHQDHRLGRRAPEIAAQA